MLTGDNFALTATVAPETATDKSVSWTSSDSSVVSVNNGVLTANKAGSAAISVTTTDGGYTATCNVTVEDPVYEADAIVITTVTPENFYVGDSPIALEAQITPANTTNKTITWASGNPDVASVNDNGVVTPVSAGTAVITAKTHNDKTHSITITVKQHTTSINIVEETINMHVGDEDKSLTVEVGPQDANDKTYSLTSNNEEAVTIVDGKIHALGNGQATITATSNDDNSVKDTCVVNVSTHTTSISINSGAESVTVNENGTVQLSATVEPSTSSYSVTWSSGDETKATVDQNGLVTAAANGKGTVTITATSEGKSDTITVNILRPVNSFALSESTKNLYVGGEFTLTPNFNNEDPSNTSVTWESNNENVATVIDGKVTAKAMGTATITAVTVDGNKQATCVVTVYTKLNSVALNNGAEINLNNGETKDISVSYNPNTYELIAEPQILWSSNKENVATVDQTGKITATGKGSATITYKVFDGIGFVEGVVTVNVTNPVTGISLIETATVDQYSSITLTPEIAPENPDAYSITWSSDNEGIATVLNGVVTGKTPGSTTITAKISDNIYDTCVVTVNEAPSPYEFGLVLDPNDIQDGDYIFFGAYNEHAMSKTTLDNLGHFADDGNVISPVSIDEYFANGNVVLPENHSVGILKAEKVTNEDFTDGKDNVFAFKNETTNKYLFTKTGDDTKLYAGDLEKNACYQILTKDDGSFVVQNQTAVVNTTSNFRCISFKSSKFGSYTNNYPIQIFKRNHVYTEPELESFTLSISDSELTVGDTITVSLNTISPSFFKDLDLTFTYDEDLFDFVSKATNPCSITLKATSPTTGESTTSISACVVNNEAITYEISGITIAEQSSGSEEPVEPTWNLVKDASSLAVGDTIIIAAKDSNFALSTTQNNNNRARIGITKSADKEQIINPSNSVQELTLENGVTDGTFAFNTGNGYLHAASSSSNYLRTKNEINNNSSFKIEIANANEYSATIKSTGAYTRNWLRYNNSDSIFSCYASGQQDVVIYKFGVSSGTETPQTPVLESLSLEGTPKTNYKVGDNFSWGDAKIFANYSVGERKELEKTDVTVTPSTNLQTANKEVVIKYTKVSKTVSLIINIVVEENSSSGELNEDSETLNIFANKGTESGKSIFWEGSNFTFTNNQGSSTNAIRTSDADHYRCYANSNASILLTRENSYFNKIIITCSGTSYATALKTSIGEVDGASVSVSGSTVTITYTSINVTELLINKFSGQVRIESIQVEFFYR